MKRDTIAGKNGYEIPVVYEINDERIVCVVSHGFGSSKDGPTSLALFDELPRRGAGVIAYDFPGHGDSPVDGVTLRVENCTSDLETVIEYAKKMAPEAETVCFSSSFGAYITLIHLSKHPNAVKNAFLRSAAVNMPLLFGNPNADERESLRRNGWLMLDMGFTRPIKITTDFIADLEAHDLFRLYSPGVRLRMAHGERDELISVDAARSFAEKFGAELYVIPGGDHRLSTPGSPERVIELAAEFFVGRK